MSAVEAAAPASLEALRAALPDVARDIKLNLQSVLSGGALSSEQRWGVAVAASLAARNPQLCAAVLEEARRAVPDAVVADAQAAAALMAMNNVYYRFRHMIAKPAYAQKPARLRMSRLAQPAAAKVDFELFALAVSAVNGCELCLRAHEEAILAGGLTDEHVHDAVRIAATMQAAAVSLEIAAR
jgi:alkyl hydroperoxide reductase subunit D